MNLLNALNAARTMLKNYAAIYRHGHLNWLDDVPQQENVQIIYYLNEQLPEAVKTQVDNAIML